MVNKKYTKITVERIAKRRLICIRPTILKKKNEREKKKHIQPEKYKVFKKKEAARGRFEQLQVSTATSTLETKQFLSWSVHKTERLLSSSPQKKARVIGTLAKKAQSMYSCT